MGIPNYIFMRSSLHTTLLLFAIIAGQTLSSVKLSNSVALTRATQSRRLATKHQMSASPERHLGIKMPKKMCKPAAIAGEFLLAEAIGCARKYAMSHIGMLGK